MSYTAINNKRIVKNTLLLYFRMLLMMLISFYTSRVILNALGVDDYGIYNVVGGVVAMFSILSGTLSAAISRFITFALGKGDIVYLKKVFCTSVNVQILLAIIIAILLETVGFWFLNHKMTIPVNRLFAANVVFQISIISFIINLWSIPYNASIIAHEKMSVFAYISIFESLAKLGIAFIVSYSPVDKLIVYAILILSVSFVVRIIYGCYCKKQFVECRYFFILDKPLLKEMFSFSGWNFIGASSAVLRDQGSNLLINIFCGPSVNAARGIATQVSSAVGSFVNNFMVAVNPQITKSYAVKDWNYTINLVVTSARFSYYILLIFTVPLIMCIDYILKLWLGIVPDYTAIFIRLILFFTLSESLANPLITVMLANGNIRNYQIIVGGCQLFNIPISYILLHLGHSVEIVFIVNIIISVIANFMRVYMLKGMLSFSISAFFKTVFLNVTIVTMISFIVPTIIYMYIPHGGIYALILCLISIVSVIMSIYFFGLYKNEKKLILNKTKIFVSQIIKL